MERLSIIITNLFKSIGLMILVCLVGILVLISLFYVILLFNCPPALENQVNKQDSLVLVDLCNTTNIGRFMKGPKGSFMWNPEYPVSHWDGVTVKGGRVTKICFYDYYNSDDFGDEQGVDIKGYLPESLGELTNLTHLIICGNNKSHITGSIPTSLGKLTQLTHLTLRVHGLTGSIPTSLGNLVNLTDLRLYKNNLSGSIPESLGNLKNLKMLELSSNQLSGSIPKSFENLKNLKDLNLKYNKLNGIVPLSFGKIDSSQNYFLQNNHFNFSSIENIPNIEKANIWLDPQSNIPIHKEGNLLTISVGGKPITDTFMWYQNEKLISTKVGDSTYFARRTGKYWCIAKSALIKKLTLQSDTVKIKFN